MNKGRAPTLASTPQALLIATGCALLLLVVGGWFATLQNVWIDESTQLLGSRLAVSRLVRWLAGGFEPLGVPGDRMPPGSYLVDWLCGRTVCAAPLSFRLLHLAATAVGVAIVAWLAASRHGARAGLVAGFFLALLPLTASVGVEIRAYPWFFLLTAVQLLLLQRLFETPALSPARLAWFTFVGLVAVYTHFFGLVAASALFAGLVVARVRSGRDALLVGVAWAALLALSAGLAPFVGGARAISAPAEANPTGAGAIAGYLPRIVASAPMLLAPVATGLFLVGLAATVAIAGVGALRPALGDPRRRLGAVAAVAVAVVAGIVVTILAAFVVHGFNPMKPSYSVWLLPPLALLAGVAAARSGIGAAAAGVMLLALLWIEAGFVRHAGLFVHGPERAIAEAIGADPRDVAIVHVGAEWGYAYFPLVYDFGGGLAHYHLGNDGRLRPISPGGAEGAPIAPATLDRYRRLLLAEVATRTGGELRAMLGGKADPRDAAPLDLAGLPFARWRVAGRALRPGLYRLRLTRLERRP